MDWLLKNARLQNSLVDIAIHKGLIAGIECVGTGLDSAESRQSRDLEGRVVLSGLVDAHTHLDKTFATFENNSGTLSEAINIWQRVRKGRTSAEIGRSATRAIKLAIANGVTAMRSHIDINAPDQLTVVETLLALRETWRDKIDLQFVALGTSSGKKEWFDGMQTSLAMGVDLIGGCPALRPDPKAEIDAVFALAAQTGKPIDLHIDETEDPDMLSLEYLAEQTIVRGMQGNVTAGHCCSLAFADEVTAKRIIDKVAEAQLHIVTLPSCNLVLMGRNQHPMPRGTTRVKQLLAAGVNVCAASDNVHDPFNPFGSYDLLRIANLNAHVAHMTGSAELQESVHMVTNRAASCLNLPDYGITVDNKADLIILDTSNPLDAILAPPARVATFKNGQLLVETTIQQTWHT